MSGNFNMKEWMHQNGQGPYKLHENYIDLKALGSLKEKDEEEIEPDQKKPGKPDQEEKPGRPPHATSIKPWWEKEIEDEEERMSNKYTKNLDDQESGALEEADREGMLDFKHAGNIGKVPVMVATGDSRTEYEIIGPHKDGTYRAFIGDDQIDDTYDNIYKLKAYLNSIEAGKSTIEENLNEEEGTFDYEENCTGNVLAYKTTYKGGEIDMVSDVDFKLKFGLYVEARSYGIKSMDIVNLQGPSELDIEIEYYPQGSEDTATEVVTLPVDWSTVNMEKDTEMSYIGLAKNVDIELQNDSKGNLMIRAITVYYNSL